MTQVRGVLILAGALVAGAVAGAQAGSRPGESGAIGAGLALGAPSGISAKYWLNRRNAIAGAIGGLGYRGAVLHADYLWHRRDIVRSAPSGTTALYFGPGAFLASGGYKEKTTAVPGIRGVGGFTYMFARDPFDLFIEIAPNLVFGSGVGFGFQGALGGRYYF